MSSILWNSLYVSSPNSADSSMVARVVAREGAGWQPSMPAPTAVEYPVGGGPVIGSGSPVFGSTIGETLWKAGLAGPR